VSSARVVPGLDGSSGRRRQPGDDQLRPEPSRASYHPIIPERCRKAHPSVNPAAAPIRSPRPGMTCHGRVPAVPCSR